MNQLQMLLRALFAQKDQQATQTRTGLPDLFGGSNKEQPQVDPNLRLLVGSQLNTRSARDTAGNYRLPGDRNYWSGPSGLDAYREMNNGKVSSVFENDGPALTSTEKVSNRINKLRGQYPNEDLTTLLRRLK